METSNDASDFFLMSERLTPAERTRSAQIRAFVRNDLEPVISEAWERAEFPMSIVPALRKLGVAGTTISDHGCPGMTVREQGLTAFELSRGDGSINTFLAVQSGLAMGTIDLLGSEEQRSRWLPGMARLELIGAFAMTEPGHGSDSVALETRAERQGDSYVLSGAKRWIGNGSIANITIIWARDTADDEVKAFVLERLDGEDFPAGYRPEVITGKIGKRAIQQADITIDQLRLPADQLLARSQNFADAVTVLNRTRANASWEALGHASAAFDIALAYAHEREQFGSPIAATQLVQNRLAEMLADISAMTTLCFRAAELAEDDRLTGPMSSLLKLHTANRGRAVCRSARDLLGGNGLLLERHIARHLTDMEVVHTYEGTEFIQSLLVGRELTGISAFSRGKSPRRAATQQGSGVLR